MRNTPHSVDNSPAQLRYNARRLSAPNIQDSTRLSPLVTGKVTPIQQQVRFLTTQLTFVCTYRQRHRFSYHLGTGSMQTRGAVYTLTLKRSKVPLTKTATLTVHENEPLSSIH